MLKHFEIPTNRWMRAAFFLMAGAALIWTAGLAGSLTWNLWQERQVLEEDARLIARTAFEKDVLYRRWNSASDGVYVPITPTTPPNPYLNDYPNQNITTSDGKTYTLINPAYMNRQVFDLSQSGVIGHITSLNPIRPENGPDGWEANALRAFEGGAAEFSSVEPFQNGQYLRLMRPLYVEEQCLPCHAQQGYVVGQVRGGISENVPLAPLDQASRSHRDVLILAHAGIWLAGLLGLGVFGNRLNLSLNRQVEAEHHLLELSINDSLTGLKNRHFFEQTLRQMEKEQVKPVSLLVADIDDLKKVNDSQGHAAGDRLIQRAAAILNESFRASDIISRTGGDEFVVILPGADEIQAAVLLNRVRQNLARHNLELPDQPLVISLGIATSSDHGSLHETLTEADSQMYAEKVGHKKIKI